MTQFLSQSNRGLLFQMDIIIIAWMSLANEWDGLPGDGVIMLLSMLKNNI